MGTGDVFQLTYYYLCDLGRRYSREKFKADKNSKEPSAQFLKSTTKKEL